MDSIKDVFNYIQIIGILTSGPTLVASIGLILATSSFISGLQLIKGNQSTIEGRIHRINGRFSIIVLAVLILISLYQYGILRWSIFGWVGVMLLIMLKLWIVRKKRGRLLKYASWLGLFLICIWIYIVFNHLPA